jgi:hypothetical protein
MGPVIIVVITMPKKRVTFEDQAQDEEHVYNILFKIFFTVVIAKISIIIEELYMKKTGSGLFVSNNGPLILLYTLNTIGFITMMTILIDLYYKFYSFWTLKQFD